MRQASPDVLLWIALAPLKRGSFEDYVVALHRRCRDEGLRLSAVFETPCADRVREWFDAEGLEYLLIPEGILKSAPGFLRRLAVTRPRVLHLHYLGMTVLRGVGARIFVRDGVLVHDHSSRTTIPEADPGRRRPGVLRRLRATSIIGMADHIVAVSDYVASSLIEEVPGAADKVVVIHNGVSLERFHPPDSKGRVDGYFLRAGSGDRGPVLTYVGALETEKGFAEYLLLAEAVAGMTERPGFLIVGEGALAAPARAFCNRVGPERARYLGRRDDVDRILRCTDVLIAPSQWREAFGLSLAEASASGVPVVSSRIGAVPEVVEDGETGILADPGDTAALEQAVRALIRDPGLRRRMGAAGRAKAEREFSLDRAVSETVALYRELLR